MNFSFDSFAWCINLSSIYILNNITEIDYDAFEDCHSLKAIYVPKGRSEYYKELLYEVLHGFIIEM